MNHQRYPLAWPVGRPRTPVHKREPGRFTMRTTVTGSSGSWTRQQPLSIAEAMKRLQDELERIHARDAVLSANLQLNLDGSPRSNQKTPDDPGVCLYFTLRKAGKDTPHALPCDRYQTPAQNIAALAAHMEATRAIERYGVADLAQMYTGFTALPAPGQDTANGWRTVLGWQESDRPTLEQVEQQYRSLAKLNHPDRGGSGEAMARLNEARDQARRELQG